MDLTGVNVPPTDEWVENGGDGAFDTEAFTVSSGFEILYDFPSTDPVDKLTWTFLDGPPGLTIDDDGSIDWTPGAKDLGDWHTTLVISDGDAEVRHTFDIHVKPWLCPSFSLVFVGFGAWSFRPSRRKRR
jgi:hypothetical protein